MESKNENVKVPLISKIAYGFGDVGCNFSWMFVSNFLMIFYTDVFGISMAAVSALMLFSRFWDAINDPIVGGLTDKTKTKWGRYRPWLLIAAPITAVLLIMTFWAHPDWSDRSKVIYMVITYCLLVLGYTCVNIPYGTLCGAMTQDIDERAKINTSRSVSAMVAIGIINIITVPLIGKLGSQSAKTGYLLVAIIYGCIFAACHFFCFAKTKEQVIMPEKEKILCRDFAIDRTPPICVIDPIKATKKGFQVQTICEDNIDFAKILLYKNGSLYKESKNQKSSWEISFDHGEKWQLKIFDTAGNKEVRYLLKEELEKELERKKLLPEKKGKHKNRIFETQKQTENETHGEKQKKAGFLQKEMDPLSNETKEQEQNQKKGEEQGAAALIVVLCSLCILMMGKYRIQEKI